MADSEEVLDAVIFGASGFTGKHVVRAWLKLAATEQSAGANFKVGIAGRSRSRLEDTLHWAGITEADVRIIIADVDQPESLTTMCQQTKLVLNCVGPFRYWGEPVVAACVEAGIDYLDVCGEPEFMEKMEAQYSEKALQAGSLIVSACGFDSVPAELGVLHAARQFPPPGAPSTVESFLTIKAEHGFKGNYGTWESLVQGMGSADDLRKFRSSRPKPPRMSIPGQSLRRKDSPYWEPRVKAYALPFPGADASVVRRTMQILAQHPAGLPAAQGEAPVEGGTPVKPVQYGAYFTVPSGWHVFLLAVYGGALKLLAKDGWGRQLLLKHPGIFSYGLFSRQGPSDKQLEGTSFSFLFVSKGFSYDLEADPAASKNAKPDRQVISSVTGPEPGYVATPIILVQCALTLLTNRERLPKGGVYTPGTVFGFTDLQQRLDSNGIKFSLLSESQI